MSLVVQNQLLLIGLLVSLVVNVYALICCRDWRSAARCEEAFRQTREKLARDFYYMVTDGSGKQYGPLKMTGDDWWIDQDGTYLQFHSPATIQRIETLRPLTRCPSPAPHYNDE